MEKYNHQEIEHKWQKVWGEEEIYKIKDEENKLKYYVLDMFPYPSGAGLHVGHPKGYIATDILARYKMMNGFNVLHPMGWDAFGLPAENFALKNKIHPRICTEKNIQTFKNQLEKIGLTYDWSREINTTDPEYYKWTQWTFIKMWEKGLAFESEEPIIWCPKCKTGLAMEDLENGKCERCESEVERKPMRQWVIKITDYADRLLEDLDKLPGWEDSIKEMQRNWIGRSEGAEIEFEIRNKKNEKREDKVKVFTTRPDTLFGCTYIVLAPEHPLVSSFIFHISNKEEVDKYIEESRKKTDLQRTDLNKDKTGVKLEGIMAINPVNGEEVPVFVADYVLGNYGTGAVMAVPAHDERDFEFAKKYNLPIKTVVSPLCHSERSDSEVKNLLGNKQKEKIKVIILHGQDSREKKDEPPQNVRHWLGWLKNELEKKEIIAVNPLIPKDWEAGYEEWRKEFEKNKIDENTILVGTSAGGAFIIRWLGETKKKVKKVLLAAPAKFPRDNEPQTKIIDFYNFEIDKSIKDRCDDVVIFISNDEQRHLDAAKIYSKELSARIVKLENRGHFTIKHNPKNNEFPELLNEILNFLNNNAFCEEGVNVNSDFLNGLPTSEAKKKIVEWLEKEGKGRKKVNYKLNDWVFSRQRYWGEPIPMIHCDKCGTVPVDEKDLPIKLPDVEHYEPTGTGESPLAGIDSWVNTTCPKCGGPAKRETNTMPQWAGSSWYYLRYIDPKNDSVLVDKDKEKYWSPVDFYVGGAEHATRHLIYARFWHKFLYDLGVVNHEEPFNKFTHVGLIMAEDGRKMSKRWGNVINPDDIIDKYGADAMRVYEMFMGPFTSAVAWSTNGLTGARKFLDRIWNLSDTICHPERSDSEARDLSRSDKEISSLLHKTIKKISEDISEFKFNTCVSALMILVNAVEEKRISVEDFAKFIQILAPFAPHLAEEIWRDKLGNTESVFKSAWPQYDTELIKDDVVKLVVQINGKLRAAIEVAADISEEEVKKLAMENENIKKWLESKEIKKVIFVPGKLLNIVI